MNPLEDFVVKLGAEFSLNPDLIVERAGRYFLLSRRLQNLMRGEFYYAGTYLGKVKKGLFFPSFIMLAMIARGKANKIVVDRKAAWLFICGRDIFRRGILASNGSQQKGDSVLVMNEFDECLGFGKILRTLNAAVKTTEVVLQNISDVGDFLRREP